MWVYVFVRVRERERERERYTHTCVVIQTLAGVASFSAAADAVGSAGLGVAQVHLSLAVVPREACRAAAPQAVDWVEIGRAHV